MHSGRQNQRSANRQGIQRGESSGNYRCAETARPMTKALPSGKLRRGIRQAIVSKVTSDRLMVVTVVAARTNRVSPALPVIVSDGLNGYPLSGD